MQPRKRQLDAATESLELKTLMFKVFRGLGGEHMTIAEIWPSKMRFPMQALIVALSRATDWFEGIPMTAFQVIDMESNMVLSADHFFEDEASSGQTHTVQIVFTSHC